MVRALVVERSCGGRKEERRLKRDQSWRWSFRRIGLASCEHEQMDFPTGRKLECQRTRLGDRNESRPIADDCSHRSTAFIDKPTADPASDRQARARPVHRAQQCAIVTRLERLPLRRFRRYVSLFPLLYTRVHTERRVLLCLRTRQTSKCVCLERFESQEPHNPQQPADTVSQAESGGESQAESAQRSVGRHLGPRIKSHFFRGFNKSS